MQGHDMTARRATTRQFDGIFRRIALWHRNRRTRRTLAQLPPALLDDIGITPFEARREAARPFWQGLL